MNTLHAISIIISKILGIYGNILHHKHAMYHTDCLAKLP